MKNTVSDRLVPEKTLDGSLPVPSRATATLVLRRPHTFKAQLILVYCLALALTVGLQWRNGAFKAEFTSLSDESAHYVTGLMLHDYIAHGFPASPMIYAQNYYDHYPRIALGHWPPVFYILQALWTVPFGVSRISLIMLMAAISASLLTTTYALSARYFPRWLSLALMIFLAGLPALQELSSAVMSEVLVSLLVLWSVLMLERYFAAPSWFSAAGFGLTAAATILTKGTGLVLALVPAPAAVLNRHRVHFRKASFWISAALVVLICAPWFLFVPGALHERVAKFGGIVFQPTRVRDSLVYLVDELSFGGFALACAGMVAALFKEPTTLAIDDEELTKSSSFWTLLLLLFLSTIVLRMVIAVWVDRHLVTLLPFFTLLIGAGIWWTVDVTFHRGRTGVMLALIALAGIFGVNVSRAAPKRHLGLDTVAQDLVKDPRFKKSRLLIASDSSGEGVFVAEVAMREERPGHFVERGSKLLATDGFMGDDYQLKFRTPGELMNFLEMEPSRVVVVDAPHYPPAHLDMVRRTIMEYPSSWKLVASYPRIDKDKWQTLGIQVYALAR
jgi:hypothetical protein